MPTPFPLRKGVFSGAEGEGVLFLVRIPLVLVMGGIGHEYSRAVRHFLCAHHMNQVCGLGPHLNEYKCASMRQNLSSGFPIRSYQNQPSQPQRLDRIVKSRVLI